MNKKRLRDNLAVLLVEELRKWKEVENALRTSYSRKEYEEFLYKKAHDFLKNPMLKELWDEE